MANFASVNGSLDCKTIVKENKIKEHVPNAENVSSKNVSKRRVVVMDRMDEHKIFR